MMAAKCKRVARHRRKRIERRARVRGNDNEYVALKYAW